MTIRVKPGSSRSFVGGSFGDPPALVVSVTAPAVDGRANDAVLEALARALALRQRNLSIASGHTARTKIVRIDVDDAAAVQTQIDTLLHSR